MPRTRKNGFTLIELLVAMAVASILGAVIVAAYTSQVRAKNTQEALTDMNQNARAALEIMTHEIRLAGLDPTENANARIITATTGELAFSMDRGNGSTHKPDGDTNDPNENIRYALSAQGHLGRDTGGGLQPLARNVDALNFVYLDAAGMPVAGTQAIRAIQVTIVARAGTASGGFMYSYTNNDAYFNQQPGPPILPAQGDAFRRLRLTTTIACRNNM